MATKKMYRLLNLETGEITVYNWQLTGCVVLNEIIIDFDNEVKEEHHQMILAAIEKRKEALCAELVMLDQRKQELLCITHAKHKEVYANQDNISDAEFEEIMNGNQN